jgi:hypothetical protein
MEIQKNLRADYFKAVTSKWEVPPTEKETPVTHDDPDALDANVVFAGLGVDGLASGASIASG